MNRRQLIAMLAALTGTRAASHAAFKGAKYTVKRGTVLRRKRGEDRAATVENIVEFHLTADEAFPVRALDPVLHIGAYEVRDYRYGNMENTLLIFTCAEPDRLAEAAPVFFQYENDHKTRTDLAPYSKNN